MKINTILSLLMACVYLTNNPGYPMDLPADSDEIKNAGSTVSLRPLQKRLQILLNKEKRHQ